MCCCAVCPVKFYSSLFFPIISVLLEPQDRNLSHGWLIIWSTVSRGVAVPLLPRDNLDLATCLRPFRTRDSSSGGKDGLSVTTVTSPEWLTAETFVGFFLLSFCLFLHCLFQMLSFSLMLSHTHSFSCVFA